MIEGIPKISVLVITYNQEDVISRTMESLLAQRDYIYEICVSDDCSKDSTWDILQDYSARYPGLYVLNRNNPNVGIFENIEKSWSMPSGDIIYQLAGDDECGQDWFMRVVEFIQKERVDFKNERFCIYGDYKEIYANGATITHNQKIVKNNDNLLGAAIKGLVSNRSTCYSKKVLDSFKKVSCGRSYMVESAQNRQLQLFSCRNYYLHYVGNIYYAGIGISSHMNSKILNEQKDEWTYLKKILISEGTQLDSKSVAFINYKTYYLNHHYFKAYLSFLQSLDCTSISTLIRVYFMKIIKRTPLFNNHNFSV